jgi:ribosomal-protein-alanine N-acetyltransferase
MRRSLGITEPAASRLEITRMRRRHLRGVMAIERQVYARPWSPNLFVAEMTEPNNRCYLVARIDKVVVGYAGMICYGDEAHITNIAVDPQRHRHGIGARLLYEQLRQTIEMGAHAVSLEVRVTNWGAQRLYGRYGFHPVGIRRNYYQELNEDALIMWTDDVRTGPYGTRLDEIAVWLAVVPPAPGPAT